MESFVLKVPILGFHLPFYERNAITRARFTIIWRSTSKGSRAQMVRDFFFSNGETYIWQEDDAKIIKVPWAPHNINLARAITWLVGGTIYCTILKQQFTSTSPVFTRQNTFEKKLARGNVHGTNY